MHTIIVNILESGYNEEKRRNTGGNQSGTLVPREVQMTRTPEECEKEDTETQLEEARDLLDEKREVYFPATVEAEYRGRFELFDRNGDGLLSLTELKVVIIICTGYLIDRSSLWLLIFNLTLTLSKRLITP